MDLTEFIHALILLVSTVITVFLVPWIRQKYGAEKLETVRIWARAAIAAAEKLYEGDGRSKEKLDYVLDFLEERGFGVDRDSLEKLVEAELYSLGLK